MAPHTGDVDMAAVGELLADRARCRMLLALADGRALPASTLADEAGVAPSTASGHLGRLTARGLTEVVATGRYRYYRLAGPEVARLVEVLGRIAPARPVRSLREGTRAHAMRLARRCYDHLAGRLGVAVTDALRERSWIEGSDGTPDPHERRGHQLPGPVADDGAYRLTDTGRAGLAAAGVAVPAGMAAVRCCVDWTEQRHHLAGPLATALLARFDADGWLRATPGHRALKVTDDGVAGLAERFGVAWPPPAVDLARRGSVQRDAGNTVGSPLEGGHR
ncbi:helix-turn-helix transcriptional regulator [Actinomycetospora chlora]|uniref:ArsR/SmtB family transcription factor n=1 Tax=Actinomycetospora chlora TaxID=663608 RepID=UPI0031EA5379